MEILLDRWGSRYSVADSDLAYFIREYVMPIFEEQKELAMLDKGDTDDVILRDSVSLALDDYREDSKM